MRKLLLISIACFAGSAFAGIHVETITRDIKTKAQQGDTQTMLHQNGMLRVNASAGSSMILKGPNMIMLDDKNRQYREMSKDDMKKMAEQGAAMMARMREQMKNMKPEQRAEMERVMGKSIPGGLGDGTPDAYEARNLGKSDKVEGRQCQLWMMMRNGKPFTEMCVVPFSSLPGSEDFGQAFKGMQEAFGDMAKSMPGAEQTAKAYSDIKGYPVRTRSYDATGKFQPTENILTKWVTESIPASAFEVPAGYKKMQMPRMN